MITSDQGNRERGRDKRGAFYTGTIAGPPLEIPKTEN